MDGETPVALENAEIVVTTLEDEPVTSGSTDIDGAYAIMGLDAGTYKVYSSLYGYVTSETFEVEIVAGNKTTQDFVLEVVAEEAGN